VTIDEKRKRALEQIRDLTKINNQHKEHPVMGLIYSTALFTEDCDEKMMDSSTKVNNTILEANKKRSNSDNQRFIKRIP